MKNGNLYKMIAVLWALVVLSAFTFAQEADKKVEKKKTIMVKMEIDDAGETTTVDTIIMFDHDMDMEKILKDVRDAAFIDEARMKEIEVEVITGLEDAHKMMKFELSQSQEDLQKAFEDLQKELSELKIDEEAQKRIDEAMKKLEEVDWNAHGESLKNALMEAHHGVFFGDEGETHEIIIEGDDTTHVISKVMWVDKDCKEPSNQNVNVWVTDDGEKKVIVKTKVDGNSDENVYFFNKEDASDGKKLIIKSSADSDSDQDFVFITKDGKKIEGDQKVIIMEMEGDDDMKMNMTMIKSADDDDIKKAQEAGLGINADNQLEINGIDIKIDTEKGAVLSFESDESGKMKMTSYDENFKKVKQFKSEENEGKHLFNLSFDEFKNQQTKYYLLEQNKKFELLRVK